MKCHSCGPEIWYQRGVVRESRRLHSQDRAQAGCRGVRRISSPRCFCRWQVQRKQTLRASQDTGVCGQADLIVVLDEKKKICRVQDYKININSEEISSNLKPLAPFDKLPANKITKYQLQLSVYANLLEKSGWKVEGLDVFVYEDKWKHFELSVLKVLD